MSPYDSRQPRHELDLPFERLHLATSDQRLGDKTCDVGGTLELSPARQDCQHQSPARRIIGALNRPVADVECSRPSLRADATSTTR